MNSQSPPQSASRLTLIIATLGSGGAERVLSTLANYWSGQGKSITLLTIGDAGDDFYPLAAGIERVALNMLADSRNPAHALLNNMRRIGRLREAIVRSRPDAIISFTDTTNILVLTASRGTGIPVIVSERIDPRVYSIGYLRDRARRFMYRRADAVVVQTEGVREWARGFLRRERVWVIPNPISRSDGVSETAVSAGLVIPLQPFVAAMGRLDAQKGFDLLMQAFAEAVSAFPEWSLVIMGGGQERDRLLALAQQLRISSRVHLPGLVPNPEPVLRNADMFVLSSRFEGFPNALLEAMSFGCAVVSFDCPSGPSDLISDGENGLLVAAEDTKALATAMGRLMESPELRARLGAAASGVQQRFALPVIASQWEQLIARVL